MATISTTPIRQDDSERRVCPRCGNEVTPEQQARCRCSRLHRPVSPPGR